MTRGASTAAELSRGDRFPLGTVSRIWIYAQGRPLGTVGPCERPPSRSAYLYEISTERRRLATLGHDVGESVRYEGVVEFFELRDLDGNKIGFVTELT